VLSILFLLALQDTLRIRPIARPPETAAQLDSVTLGQPSIRIRTGQGIARVWLLRAHDTVFVAAVIPDTTPYWGDDFVLSIDTRGDAAERPQHDDFQLDLRRVLDSSVVYRGRNARWEPPRDDPDWRLGRDRAGGGWEVSAGDNSQGWRLLLRLDPAWFEEESGHVPRIAFRIYDNAPGGWFAWPEPRGRVPAKQVEESPAWWSPIR
jgi:hypothetical protein